MNYHNASEAKKLIFQKAVELFATMSFEIVTMNDLARAVGRTKSSLYNHFSSKQEILDEIYDYFCDHFIDNRNTLKEVEPILRHGSVMDIIHSVIFVFGDSASLMMPILQIIHQRKFYDDRAREIVRDILINDGIEYAKEIFDQAVHIGRLAPFDTHLLSVLCNNSRLVMYDKWIVNPTEENYHSLITEEDQIFTLISGLLTDLNAVNT